MRTFNNIEEIKKERQEQRSNAIVYSLLGVLLGELDRLPTRENPTPDQIYAVIKKLYEAAKEMREMTPEADQEYMYLKDFIKKQLSESDIRFEIEDLMLSKDFNIGVVMKHFKDWYPGQYDGKLVSKIAKEYLK